MRCLDHDASPDRQLQLQSMNTTLPPTASSPKWLHETSRNRRLFLPVLLPTLLQAAFTAEINFGHHEEVCQHSNTPGLLQNPERKHKWGLSAGHPHTTMTGSFPTRTSPFSRVPRREASEPDSAGHQGLLSTSILQGWKVPIFLWGSTPTCLVTPLSRMCLARHSRDRGTFSSRQKWSSSSASHRVDRRLPITRSTERRWEAPSSIPSSTWTQRSHKNL